MSAKDSTAIETASEIMDAPTPSMASMAALTKLFDVTTSAAEALINNRPMDVQKILGIEAPKERIKNYRFDSGLYFPCEGPSEVIVQDLPVGNYQIVATPIGLALKAVDQLKIPSKVYGDVLDVRDRIFKTFMSRSAGTGVLLRGDKGSGKTVLAKALSVKAAEMGLPTITINEPMCGDSFNRFIQNIGTSAIVLFDEFEKVYNKREHQEALLTLLDGTYPSHKMFVLTSNDSYALNEHMNNRPGRIFYTIRYSGMPMDAIKEYLEDKLEDKKYMNLLLKVCQAFGKINFDSLQALVEEMNRYKEHPRLALKMLNTAPDASGSGGYIGNLTFQELPLGMAVTDSYWSHTPLLQNHLNFTIVATRLSPELRARMAAVMKIVDAKMKESGKKKEEDELLLESGIDPDDLQNAPDMDAVGRLVTNVRSVPVVDKDDKETGDRTLTSFTITIQQKDLVAQDPLKGTFTYVAGDFTATFTCQRVAASSLLDALWSQDERDQAVLAATNA